MRRGIVVAFLVGLLISVTSGCRCFTRSSAYPRCSNCTPPPPLGPTQRLTPQPIAPFGSQPPASSPGVNPYADPLTPTPIPGTQEERVPEDFNQDRISPIPRAQDQDDRIPADTWRAPTDPSARLYGPESPSTPGDQGQKKTPIVEEKVEQEKNDARARPMPPVDPEDERIDPNVPFFPADIPQFARVKAGVYSGEKPFPEGLTWLKDKNYRTVVHLHDPKEKTDVFRRQFEAKGFRYLPLAVSPETLDRSLVDQFNHVITDTTNHPIFVFDLDGSLAGPMWLLHFRIVDRLDTKTATDKASGLGLRERGDDFSRRMLLAAQAVLEKSKP